VQSGSHVTADVMSGSHVTADVMSGFLLLHEHSKE
jgi:hypothetical protein